MQTVSQTEHYKKFMYTNDDFDCVFNITDNERIKQGKQQGQSPQVVEFYRAQVLKSEGMLKEREDMKTNLNIVKCSANEIVLGILAESGSQGLTTLRSWVEGLQIARGVLNAFDQAGREINVDALNNSAVYIKYNSTDCGNAYMKPSPDEGFAGVVFQPKFSNPIEGEFFHQFGNFPLWLFS